MHYKASPLVQSLRIHRSTNIGSNYIENKKLYISKKNTIGENIAIAINKKL